MPDRSNLLWRPAPEIAASTQIERFRRRLDSPERPLPDFDALWRWSMKDRTGFWTALWDFAEIVGERGDVALLEPDAMPGSRWFPEARLNFAENLLRPFENRGADRALVFRGERGGRRVVSGAELLAETSRWRGALNAAGLNAGDRVAALLPNVPEAIFLMLAAASMGVTFTSCSPDFGARGVLDRFGQVEPRLLVTVDAYDYGGKRHPMHEKLTEILAGLSSVERVVVIPFGSDPRLSGLAENPESDPEVAALLDPQNAFAVLDTADRICSQADFLRAHSAGDIDFVPLPFDHPLYVLYSSGTTGPPKCIVHGAGGTLLQHRKEHLLHTNLQPGDGLFYFTTLGWMMWNWLATGLASGATLHLYDGSPFHPSPETLFDYAAEEKTSVFGTSAKFLEAARNAQIDPARTHDLSALRTVLSTGSPLAPESFDWVYDHIKRDVHLASISGGTDIVSCFLLGNPSAPVLRGELQVPGLGMAVDVWDDAGAPADEGELVCSQSFPSMPLGFWNDEDGTRYRSAYFERFPGAWCHGDFIVRSQSGGFVVEGRSDAVLNPGGVRIGTAEIYRHVERLEAVEEAIAIGQQWEGDVRIILFVKLRDGFVLDEALVREIRTRLRADASPRHVPAEVLEVPEIPRTRSGKIVELAVRDVVHGRPVRNAEALSNPEALDHFRNRPELQSESHRD